MSLSHTCLCENPFWCGVTNHNFCLTKALILCLRKQFTQNETFVFCFVIKKETLHNLLFLLLTNIPCFLHPYRRRYLFLLEVTRLSGEHMVWKQVPGLLFSTTPVPLWQPRSVFTHVILVTTIGLAKRFHCKYSTRLHLTPSQSCLQPFRCSSVSILQWCNIVQTVRW